MTRKLAQTTRRTDHAVCADPGQGAHRVEPAAKMVDCVATGWAGQCVRVEMPERAIMLWLDAVDVRRR